MPAEVFLSHSSADREFVKDLAELLRRHGVPVWYSGTEIVGAQQWHDEIGAALARCDWFVLVLSPDAVNSMWVKRELQFALRQNRFDGRIVPLLRRECDYDALSWTLGAMQFVDCKRGLKVAGPDLMRVWGLGYRPS
ncbi:toll/interleukin-1 receptor domain-containing protein [Alienimonas sp. DA493]|uniref:toll/interleukin-1 receptor domain-containing protein n=1 Tax=Alienimonas sp. DA493 TaxID=3373605 RepID=UPI0037546E4A